MLGLLGSGEFELWQEEVDRWLLARASGSGTVLILPTASAPEGDEVFEEWGRRGLAHYARLGIPAVVVPLRTRAEADRPELTDQVEEASMVFFSGGNPAYLAATLAGTAFWQAVLEAMSRGLAYAGCSAGAACLGEVAPDSSSKELSPELWTPGLGFFPRLRVLPHWDGLDTFIPGAREFVLSSVPPGHRLLTIDERTALLGDGVTWSVVGSGSAGLYSERSRRAFGPGQTFRLRSVPPETIGVLSGSPWEGGERAGRAREGRA